MKYRNASKETIDKIEGMHIPGPREIGVVVKVSKETVVATAKREILLDLKKSMDTMVNPFEKIRFRQAWDAAFDSVVGEVCKMLKELE